MLAMVPQPVLAVLLLYPQVIPESWCLISREVLFKLRLQMAGRSWFVFLPRSGEQDEKKESDASTASTVESKVRLNCMIHLVLVTIVSILSNSAPFNDENHSILLKSGKIWSRSSTSGNVKHCVPLFLAMDIGEILP
jgi:hypothetical protein